MSRASEKMNRRRTQPVIPVGSRLHHVIEYSLLFIGAFIIAMTFNLLLNPNRIASGGVAGISTIVEHYFGVAPALTQWALNIPLILLGMWLLGGSFGLRTIIGSLLLPFFVFLTSGWGPLTENLLLASIFGGLGTGAGLGLVFRGNSSTGGLDLAAQIIHKYTGLGLGAAIAVLDGCVIVAAGIAFSPEKAMFALIGLYVTSKTIDLIQLGLPYSKVAFIISEQAELIRQTILNDLDRGLTKLAGYGGYTDKQRTVLMVVVRQREVNQLKTLVRAADPNAFVIISSTTEVLGEGFKRDIPPLKQLHQNNTE